jgi:hypothetical protein
MARATGITQTHQFRDPVAHELHVLLALVLQGKSRHLELPFFVNQAGSSQLTAALESVGTVAKRFAESHALDDVVRSTTEAFAGELGPEDLVQLRDGLAQWLVMQSAKLPAPPPTRTMTLHGIEPYMLSA